MDPREQFERMQKQLAARARGVGGGPGGGLPFRSILGIAGLIGGSLFLSEALFNGMDFYVISSSVTMLICGSRRWSQSNQVYEVRWCSERYFERR